MLKKEDLISQILEKYPNGCPICNCKFSYENLSSLNIKTLEKCILIGPMYHDNKNCGKKYKYQSTHKQCLTCKKDILKKSKFNKCISCRDQEARTYTCKHCKKTIILDKRQKNFQYCDDCIINYNPDREAFDKARDAIKKLFKELAEKYKFKFYAQNLMFDKFFNKDNNKNIINKDKNPKEWNLLFNKNLSDIANKYDELELHLIQAWERNKWESNSIENIMKCLVSCAQELPGFSTSDINKTNFIYEKELPGWKELLGDTFDTVIQTLIDFKMKSKAGKGEFFYTIINSNIINNVYWKADILYNTYELGEVKSGITFSEAGHLLFKRDSWYGYNDFQKYKDNLYELLKTWVSNKTKYSSSHDIYKLINNINDFPYDKFTWNDHTGFYSQIINTLDPADINEFIKYMFNITINYYEGKYNCRFTKLDLSDENNFKIFHFVNYCLYYMYVDAKSENLNKLLFISNKEVLILNKNFLENCTIDEIKPIIKNWEIFYPESGFDSKKTSHDRNKNRAPGIYYKKGEN